MLSDVLVCVNTWCVPESHAVLLWELCIKAVLAPQHVLLIRQVVVGRGAFLHILYHADPEGGVVDKLPSK